jgi:hypothetical protein
LKVLFVMRTAGFVRNFEHVLRELAARGHEVTVAVEQPPKRDQRFESVFADLAAAGIAHEVAPNRAKQAVPMAVTQVRLALDYLRFLDPSLVDKAALRNRAANAAPSTVVSLLKRPRIREGPGRRGIEWTLRALDATVPPSREHEQFLAERQPDVVLVTPLVELGAPQTDLVRAARAAGIPTVLAVASWDNLTMKGQLREWPDEVLVWNEAQRSEGQRLHGLPPERITATGAHSYDHWFEWEPQRTRAQFLDAVGLPDRPYLLYLCSSPFIAPDEAQYVREWLQAMRSSGDEVLAQACVLVRPHPQHAAQWEHADLSDLAPVAVWPRAGADPIEALSRQDFFESMYYCRAVVGINTSALIESAIVGREVLTTLEPRFAATQSGTVHFDYLARADGGVLTVAEGRKQHLAQIASRLRGEEHGESRRRKFVEEFVRPYGLGERGAPRFADRVEEVAAAGPRPGPPAVRLARAPRRALEFAWRSPALPASALLRAYMKPKRSKRKPGKEPADMRTRAQAAWLTGRRVARELPALVGETPPTFGTELLSEALREARAPRSSP